MTLSFQSKMPKGKKETDLTCLKSYKHPNTFLAGRNKTESLSYSFAYPRVLVIDMFNKCLLNVGALIHLINTIY